MLTTVVPILQITISHNIQLASQSELILIILGGVGESNQGQADADADWMDELNDEEDSAGEDSDDEGLNSKLCTFTQTQKEFMNQHWYHCHTCKMVDGVGVCTVCAKVIQFFLCFDEIF